MSKKRIITLGIEIPGSDAKHVGLDSEISLLDYDVIIIDPVIYEFYGYRYEDYQGKPCLDDTNSFRLKEHLEHWRREIFEAIRAGKNVFFFLNEKQEVFIATGEKSFSGTGRNRQTIRHVTLISNYAIVPDGISVTNSKGSTMALVGKDCVLAPYWSSVGEISEFRVLLDEEDLKPIVQTKTGGKTVGAVLRYENAGGSLILLPYIDFQIEKYTYENEEDGEMYWNDEAIAFGKKLIGSICAVDEAIKSSTGLSPIPDWLRQDMYLLPNERKIRNRLAGIMSKMEDLQKQKEKCEQEIAEESILKRLIYENGKPLESAVHIALELIGFNVSRFENAESEFDVVFESKEGRLIGEVEGKDNKPINISKLRQLEMNIHEDFARDDVEKMAKGVLIGNAYRLQEPGERGDFFTDKCLTASARNSIALISSLDLFYVAKYLSGNSDKQFAKKCRQTIFSTIGLIILPDIPEAKEESESITEDLEDT
ncbi:MAG: hypothetical protein KJI69_05915 [Patescibacteria group bacterium]|nr:hypothetical protein [Patescibacteria group bacterium]